MSLNVNNSTFKKTGDCEVCDATGIPVHLMHHSIWMCVPCKDTETQVIQSNEEIESVLKQSKKVDESIQLKTDIFVVKTIPAMELHASILQDESIPESEKEYAFTKACYERFLHMQSVVFAKRQEISEAENELRMWQVNVQTTAAKLRSDRRDEFKKLDVNYTPAKVKSPAKVKAAASGSSKKTKFDRVACNEAAIKYGVPSAQVQSIVVSKNLGYDDAAKHLAGLLGLI